MKPIGVLLGLALAAAAAGIPASTGLPGSPAAAPALIVVDPGVRFQEFEGWGTSLAWWAKVVGGFPAAARQDYMEKAFDPVRGLGLSVVRYNIGGGENPAYLPPNQEFLSFRTAVPGYEPEPGRWDWSADANQRWVLKDAIRRGANHLEAFSNSPPYWMTVSGSVTGGHRAANNLRPDSYEVFAGYLAAVVRHFHDNWGITFGTLDPLNEPSGGWSFGKGQEGCHFDRPSQDRLVTATGGALARAGLRTRVAASDEPSIGAAVATSDHYSRTSLAYLRKINTHSYGGGDRTRLSNFAHSAGKDLWLSEYGDNDASGMRMSERILEDMNGLHPAAWVYWQVVDSAGGWGCLINPLRNETDTAYTINKKYYVMANYSRFIRPGAVFVAIGDPQSLAACSLRSHTLAIVTTNDGDDPAPVDYDLSRFRRTGAAAAAYRTSPTENLAALPVIPIRGRRFSAVLPARSVTTFVIQDVDPGRPRGFSFRKYYRLVNRKSGLAAGLPAGTSPSAGQGGADQEWWLVGVGDDCYKIVNRTSGLVLDVDHSSMTAGAEVIHYGYNGGENQQWRALRVPHGPGGVYRLINRRSGLLLSSGPDGLLQQADTGDPGQQWSVLAAR